MRILPMIKINTLVLFVIIQKIINLKGLDPLMHGLHSEVLLIYHKIQELLRLTHYPAILIMNSSSTRLIPAKLNLIIHLKECVLMAAEMLESAQIHPIVISMLIFLIIRKKITLLPYLLIPV